MKKIFIVIAMAMATVVVDAQNYEFTDIQVNTQTNVHVTSPMEPLSHAFLDAGLFFGLGDAEGSGGVSIMGGWYKKHGIFANLNFSLDESDDGASTFTVGYMYNIPFSRRTGSDTDNFCQLYFGLGYGSGPCISGLAIDYGVIFRLKHLNFRLGIDVIPGENYSDVVIGLGYTF